MSQFPPLHDRVRFPLLTTGAEEFYTPVVGCGDVTFYAPASPEGIPSLLLQPGLLWHRYGDARWPSDSAWVEFDTTPGGFAGPSAALVLRYEIPPSEADRLAWAAQNNPLREIFPEERAESVAFRRLEALRKQALEPATPDNPAGMEISAVQSYCLFRTSPQPRLVATYTDLLEKDGSVIPRYRMANVNHPDIELCRFMLHALFRLNEARKTGLEFVTYRQLEEVTPVRLSAGVGAAPWARFHPSRVFRTRPAVRTIPSPRNMMEGIMALDAVQAVMEARRHEWNFQLLAFHRDVRLRALSHEDTQACLAAFNHRANGGAIYQLPDALVEEFDHTDCDEVRLAEIKLPFTNIFLKFTPPTPLVLADGAFVDGCYVVKQGDEYLLSLTSRWEGIDYSQSLSVTCVDPTFSLHLPLPPDNPQLLVNDAVALGIAEFLEKNAPPTDNLSQSITRPDGTKAYVEDVRAQSRRRRIQVFRSQEPTFRACLNIIVNAMCFIAFRPDDFTEEWDGQPPGWAVEAIRDTRNTRSARDRHQHAQRVFATGDFTRIRICGKDFQEKKEPAEALPRAGASPRAHWRRGHWRRQRHGAGLTLIILRWIRPTLVKPDNGTLVETRLYDVQPDARPSAGPLV